MSFYEYLGMYFTPKLDLTKTKNMLSKQAIKVISNLSRYQRKFGRFDCKDTFKVFDTVVIPILCYGSEIWGFNYPEVIEKNKTKKENKKQTNKKTKKKTKNKKQNNNNNNKKTNNKKTNNNKKTKTKKQCKTKKQQQHYIRFCKLMLQTFCIRRMRKVATLHYTYV